MYSIQIDTTPLISELSSSRSAGISTHLWEAILSKLLYFSLSMLLYRHIHPEEQLVVFWSLLLARSHHHLLTPQILRPALALSLLRRLSRLPSRLLLLLSWHKKKAPTLRLTEVRTVLPTLLLSPSDSDIFYIRRITPVSTYIVWYRYSVTVHEMTDPRKEGEYLISRRSFLFILSQHDSIPIKPPFHKLPADARRKLRSVYHQHCKPSLWGQNEPLLLTLSPSCPPKIWAKFLLHYTQRAGNSHQRDQQSF